MKHVSLVLVFALGSCTFAQKHPGITTGLVAGTIGFGTCGLAVDKLGTCSIVGGIAGLAIGGITGLVTTFADTSAHDLPPLEEEEPPVVRVKTHTPPPPPPLPATVDAGVPAPAPVDAPAADAP